METNVIPELPTLYKRTSTGKIQTWRIFVVPGTEDNPAAMIFTQYGLLDGKQQTASEAITEGKNIGKSNETTPLEQAIAEAQSQWEKKSKKSYVQNIEDAEAGKVDTNFITGGVDPMLAKSYDKDGHKITFPAYVQPKLDGHRCIAIYQDGEVTLWSRTRKRITGVPHIERELAAALSNVDYTQPIILDGELYNHDYKDRFEELTSFIRSATPKPGHEVVQYWVYDIVCDAPYSQRDGMLGFMKRHFDGKTLNVLDAYLVDDEDEAMSLFETALSMGFEGAMLRNVNGKYVGKRSADLQKVKVFQDSEFEVLDVEEGKGKMAGKAMFVCDAGNGKTFRVKMMGALDDLATMYQNRDQYIGQQLTVKYQNFSADGLPRFPVALRFREDM
jgi:DNA ligase-1